jgi:hypothetical protein
MQYLTNRYRVHSCVGRSQSFPGYDSNNSASFSDANMLGFPLEMSPMRAEILRAKDVRSLDIYTQPLNQMHTLSICMVDNMHFFFLPVFFFVHVYSGCALTLLSLAICYATCLFQNRFSASFIAGGYRDSRLGVSEMRKRRVQRLRARQEVINQAQGKVRSCPCVRIHATGAIH